ncbi:MAG: hypothetical protein EP307_14040, partial [Rhodobacteraceae bacterium]
CRSRRPAARPPCRAGQHRRSRPRGARWRSPPLRSARPRPAPPRSRRWPRPVSPPAPPSRRWPCAGG